MASSVCDYCGKKPWFGKQVSHSHRRSSKRWDPNIQKLKALKDGRVQRVNIGTSCLKAGKMTRPPVSTR
jgi:large subunit ribosomal protein L28